MTVSCDISPSSSQLLSVKFPASEGSRLLYLHPESWIIAPDSVQSHYAPQRYILPPESFVVVSFKFAFPFSESLWCIIIRLYLLQGTRLPPLDDVPPILGEVICATAFPRRSFGSPAFVPVPGIVIQTAVASGVRLQRTNIHLFLIQSSRVNVHLPHHSLFSPLVPVRIVTAVGPPNILGCWP